MSKFAAVKRKSISKKVREEVYRMYDGHCAYCGCKLEYKDMQVDHVKSLYAHEGRDEIGNYKPACRACNFYKSTMSLEEFREQLETISDRLEKQFIYRLGKKYELIIETNKKVEFYFETYRKGRNK
ncbi:HNH endonuclease signature motif containing protein [Clostridium sp.]|uniref:HNH endonuclease n=1 Tax=Clostridium sp. TaxID=1506 RepID=UPI00290B6C78|nr:HNH endonuclease signature motif containing protein [Clostridium sp.]MDU4427642.1 HNH endonuclease signature motif containing protein [Clostridium sp.]MDU7458749.1 HNH endonuclease signature motif containing protein [Clostridium perfringens]